MDILNLIYYAAIASCGVEGARKGIQKQLSIANILACSYLCALGGGIVRDIFILQTYPVALTNKSLPEIIISLVFGLLYWKFDKYRKKLEIFSVVSDAVGLSQFISIGAGKVRNNNIVAALSAVTTALLGGAVVMAFSGESTKRIILSNVPYRIITVVGAIVYITLTECGIKDTDAQGILAFYTLFAATMSNPDVIAASIRYFFKFSKSIQQCGLLRTPALLNSIFFQMCVCNNHFFCKMPTYISTAPVRSYASNRKAVFLLHRIRRM